MRVLGVFQPKISSRGYRPAPHGGGGGSPRTPLARHNAEISNPGGAFVTTLSSLKLFHTNARRAQGTSNLASWPPSVWLWHPRRARSKLSRRALGATMQPHEGRRRAVHRHPAWS